MSTNDFHNLSDKEKIDHLKSIKKENEKNYRHKSDLSKSKIKERKISNVSLPISAPKRDSLMEDAEEEILATSELNIQDKLGVQVSNAVLQDNEHQVKYISEEKLKAGDKLNVTRWILKNPSRAIIFSFAFVILFGGILLTLPISSSSGNWTDFLTAIFTATSATCVTGLILVDTGFYWSLFGQLIIISLIQVGGVGLITIIASFISSSKKKIGMGTIRIIQDTLGSDSVEDVYDLLKKVVRYTLSFELIGGTIMAIVYLKYMPPLYAIYAGLFQGVSAFCNAGFDVLSPYFSRYGSLTSLNNEPIILLVTSLLLTFGGLGFIVWTDIFASLKGKEKLSFHSSLVIRVTLGILFIGTVLHLGLEWSNEGEMALGSLPIIERPMAAFFQTATLRTAGFNSINQANLRDSSLLLGCIIMFIGASPVSTGGGVKTSTMALVSRYVVSKSKGEDRVVIRKRTVEKNTASRALVIFVIFLLVTIFATGILTVVERLALDAGNFSSLDLLYEVLSALCTVGVTSIQTENLGTISRIVLMTCMFIGRVGPFSIALFLSERAQSSDQQEVLQEVSTFVG